MTDPISPLNQVETKLTHSVVLDFLANWRPTARKLVVRQYNPAILSRLINCSVLKQSQDQKGLLPMILAFEYCGDSEKVAFARQSVEMVTKAAASLYRDATEDDPIQLTPQQIEISLKEKFGRSDAPRMLWLGLYLHQELYILGGLVPNLGDQDILRDLSKTRFVLVNERILGTNAEKIWDEFVQQKSRDLWPSSQNVQTEPVAESRKENRLLLALRAFCKDEEFESSLVRAHSKKPPKMKPSAAFELYVSWLLGLFGWSAILLGEYEKIFGDETNVERTSVDILATSQSQDLVLLIVACTLGPPKQEDFHKLRYAREILLQEVFGETFVQVMPVVFTTTLGGAKYDYLDGGETIPIVDAAGLKELLTLLKGGGADADLLAFLKSLTDLAVREFLGSDLV
jgi:hypothetical protein